MTKSLKLGIKVWLVFPRRMLLQCCAIPAALSSEYSWYSTVVGGSFTLAKTCSGGIVKLLLSE